MFNARRFLFSAGLLTLLAGCSTPPDPKETGGAKILPSKELIKWAKAGEEYMLLDVRTPPEFTQGHIPGAKNLPYVEIVQSVPKLKDWSDGRIVVYDEKGRRAALVSRVLLQAGFQKVYVLEGHLEKWRKDKLPLQ